MAAALPLPLPLALEAVAVAELAAAVGDREMALELAQAAIRPHDDRASALIAMLEFAAGSQSEQRLLELIKSIPGLRFDTLAVRNRMVQAYTDIMNMQV